MPTCVFARRPGPFPAESPAQSSDGTVQRRARRRAGDGVIAEFRAFHQGNLRPPTWREREIQGRLRDEGVDDVVLEPQKTPAAFWEAVVQASTTFIAQSGSPAWAAWAKEMQWATGWDPFAGQNPYTTYETMLRVGIISLANKGIGAHLGDKLSAVEHLLDIAGPDGKEFVERVNERARWLRVGLRIEGRRFVPVTEEHLHTEVVQPTLLLLHNPALAAVDALYRKAFDRVFSNDPAGAVTAAVSAVEEMLRVGLGVTGFDLGQLVGKAKSAGWLSNGAGTVTNSLAALRSDSDAHTAGTSDFDLAMFAVHLAASALLHLSRAEPYGGQ